MVYPSCHMYTELFNPIYGTVNGLPVIAIGVVSASQPGTTVVNFMVVEDDGTTKTVPIDALNVDVRYRDGEWHDVSPGSMDDAS